MIAELGHFALILALLAAVMQAAFGLIGPAVDKPALTAVVRPATSAQFVLVTISLGALVWAFVQNDFSVEYVASNSNSALPLLYRVSA
ncbi:MAG: hypothetical protein RLZZ36_679, partial [Pseudomonadota bacterium]